MQYKLPLPGGEFLRVKVLRLEDIEDRMDYQRGYKHKVIQITEGWDPTIAGLLSVAEKDGGYFLWDGKQRRKAMLNLGIEEWPCMITDKTEEEAAAAFIKSAENSTAIRPLERHKAGRVAKDPSVLSLDEMVERAGFEIGHAADGIIEAISSLNKVRARGDDVLEITLAHLQAVRGLYPDPKVRKDASSGGMILGVGTFVAQHLENLDIPVDQRLVAAVERFGSPRNLLNSAKNYYGQMGASGGRDVNLVLTDAWNMAGYKPKL